MMVYESMSLWKLCFSSAEVYGALQTAGIVNRSFVRSCPLDVLRIAYYVNLRLYIWI